MKFATAVIAAGLATLTVATDMYTRPSGECMNFFYRDNLPKEDARACDRLWWDWEEYCEPDAMWEDPASICNEVDNEWYAQDIAWQTPAATDKSQCTEDSAPASKECMAAYTKTLNQCYSSEEYANTPYIWTDDCEDAEDYQEWHQEEQDLWCWGEWCANGDQSKWWKALKRQSVLTRQQKHLRHVTHTEARKQAFHEKMVLARQGATSAQEEGFNWSGATIGASTAAIALFALYQVNKQCSQKNKTENQAALLDNDFERYA